MSYLYKNIGSKRAALSHDLAYVLANHGVANGFISCIANIDHRVVTKISNAVKQINQGSGDVVKKRHISLPLYKILTLKNSPAYSELMLLYRHYHRSSPSEKLDMEALLKSWEVVNALHKSRNEAADGNKGNTAVNINYFIEICMSLIKSCDLQSDETACLKYSRRYKSYYLMSSLEPLDPDKFFKKALISDKD